MFISGEKIEPVNKKPNLFQRQCKIYRAIGQKFSKSRCCSGIRFIIPVAPFSFPRDYTRTLASFFVHSAVSLVTDDSVHLRDLPSVTIIPPHAHICRETRMKVFTRERHTGESLVKKKKSPRIIGMNDEPSREVDYSDTFFLLIPTLWTRDRSIGFAVKKSIQFVANRAFLSSPNPGISH